LRTRSSPGARRSLGLLTVERLALLVELKFKNPNGITFDVAEGERLRVSR
jgi:hypothetical protein